MSKALGERFLQPGCGSLRQTAQQGQELLELLDRWMSERDLDASPDAAGPGGARAGIGIYYFEEHDNDDNGDLS